jgi:predicted ATP-dependent serine protease
VFADFGFAGSLVRHVRRTPTLEDMVFPHFVGLSGDIRNTVLATVNPRLRGATQREGAVVSPKETDGKERNGLSTV